MSTTITVQPGQPGMGMDYDVRVPLPYPFHIDATTGDCTRGRGTTDQDEATNGRPWRLIGFQAGDVQELVLTLVDFASDPQAAYGLVPVFVDGKSPFALGVPVIDVIDHRPTDPKLTPDALLVQVWHHARRGRIRGAIVARNGDWLDIPLVGNQKLRYLSVRSDPRHGDGDVITVRASLLTEVAA